MLTLTPPPADRASIDRYGPEIPTNPALGYSLVKVGCLDNFSHTHEFGRNIGCHHNRDNSNAQFEYSHGLQYIDCTDQ